MGMKRKRGGSPPFNLNTSSSSILGVDERSSSPLSQTNNNTSTVTTAAHQDIRPGASWYGEATEQSRGLFRSSSPISPKSSPVTRVSVGGDDNKGSVVTMMEGGERHLNSRTRKRFRDARVGEEERIGKRTVQLLFEGVKKLHGQQDEGGANEDVRMDDGDGDGDSGYTSGGSGWPASLSSSSALAPQNPTETFEVEEEEEEMDGQYSSDEDRKMIEAAPKDAGTHQLSLNFPVMTPTPIESHQPIRSSSSRMEGNNDYNLVAARKEDRLQQKSLDAFFQLGRKDAGRPVEEKMDVEMDMDDVMQQQHQYHDEERKTSLLFSGYDGKERREERQWVGGIGWM